MGGSSQRVVKYRLLLSTTYIFLWFISGVVRINLRQPWEVLEQNPQAKVSLLLFRKHVLKELLLNQCFILSVGRVKYLSILMFLY